jgi:hypothetical protein
LLLFSLTASIIWGLLFGLVKADTQLFGEKQLLTMWWIQLSIKVLLWCSSYYPFSATVYEFIGYTTQIDEQPVGKLLHNYLVKKQCEDS